MAFQFAGQLFIEPGAFVVTDFDATPKVMGQSSSRVLLLAESLRGLDYTDKKVYAFQTPTTAKSVLGGGPALDLISCLFNPSPDYSGASEILFVRTNKGYNAEFRTVAPSSQKKQMRYSVNAASAGRIGFNLSIAGKRPVTVYQDVTSTLHNAMIALAKDINTLDGVIAAAASTSVTLTATEGQIDFTITEPIQPSGSTIEVSTLVDYNPRYMDEAIVIKTKDKGQDLNYAFKISGGVATFFKDGGIIDILTGIVSTQALIEAIENSTILSRAIVASATDPTAPLPADMTSPTPLTVKPNEDTDFSAFQDALNMTLGYAKNFVICQFEGAAYHQAILSYCNASVYQCLGFGGGALRETPTQVLERAFNLNSEAFTLCYPGVQLSLTGETQLYSPAYHAALACGLACGLPVQEPLTRKKLSCQGFEDIDLEGRDEKGMREELINGGVFYSYAMEDVGNAVNKGINTIQGQVNRPLLGTDNKTHEISIARIRRQMANEIRISADKAFPGRTRLYPSKADVTEFIRAYLNRCVGTYLTGWDTKTLDVHVEEDAWICSAVAFVNGPINHFFMTLSLGLDDNL